jgi:hypothetical protein
MKAIRVDIQSVIEVREIPQSELDYSQKPFCLRCEDRVNHYECEFTALKN